MRPIVVATLLLLGCAAATDFDRYSSGLPADPGGDDDDDDMPGMKDAEATDDQPVTTEEAGTDSSTAEVKVVQTGTGHAKDTAAIAANIAPSVTGNLIVVAVAVESLSTVVNVTDNVGNVYESAGARSTDPHCDGDATEIWFAKNAKGSSTAVTVHFSAATEAETWVIEASGFSMLETANVTNNAPKSTTVTAPPVTTTAARSLVVSTACSCDAVTQIAPPFHGLPFQVGEGAAWFISDAPGSFGAVWKTDNADTFNASTAAFK